MGREFSVAEHVQRFRGDLVFEAHRLWYHSTLGSRVINKKKKKKRSWPRPSADSDPQADCKSPRLFVFTFDTGDERPLSLKLSNFLNLKSNDTYGFASYERARLDLIGGTFGRSGSSLPVLTRGWMTGVVAYAPPAWGF